jgi:hypothetical protein
VAATKDTKLRQLMMSMSEAVRTIAFKANPHTPHPGGCPLPLCFGKKPCVFYLCANRTTTLV